MQRALSTLVLGSCIAGAACDSEEPQTPPPVRTAPPAEPEQAKAEGDDSVPEGNQDAIGDSEEGSDRASAEDHSETRTTAIPPPGPMAATENERNTIAVFEAAAPATVYVTQTQRVVDRWSRRALDVPAGSGSGFIWDAEGHVVTNFHVVDGAQSLKVTLLGGAEVPARFVGGDRQKDLAVLEIVPPEGTKLTPIRVRPADEALRVGEKALAIGNPFGLDHTLTVGIISALGREVEGFGKVKIRDMIQTDASINPGNSGGPLLDARGRLIGSNTMIFSKSGSSAGSGFAVPWRTVRQVVPQIIRFGVPIRAGLGITIVSDQLARKNGIQGIVVETVAPDSPAYKAGVKGLRRSSTGTFVGDVIVGIDDEPIKVYDDLYSSLDKHRPGDDVKVTVLRADKRYDVMIELTAIRARGR
jgi:S1-C subfamily serine protease